MNPCQLYVHGVELGRPREVVMMNGNGHFHWLDIPRIVHHAFDSRAPFRGTLRPTIILCIGKVVYIPGAHSQIYSTSQ